MGKQFSTKEVERILLDNGFHFLSQNGSHMKFTNGARTVVVPAGRREIPKGTLASIQRQSALRKPFHR